MFCTCGVFELIELFFNKIGTNNTHKSAYLFKTKPVIVGEMKEFEKKWKRNERIKEFFVVLETLVFFSIYKISGE